MKEEINEQTKHLKQIGRYIVAVAPRNVCREGLSSNPFGVMWDFSTLQD